MCDKKEGRRPLVPLHPAGSGTVAIQECEVAGQGPCTWSKLEGPSWLPTTVVKTEREEILLVSWGV